MLRDATEPEEIDKGIDPFANVEISSDTDSSDSNSNNNRSDMMGSNNNSNLNANDGDDTDAIPEGTLAYDILLDSVINSEDEEIDLDREGTGSRGEGTSSEGEGIGTCDEEDGEELEDGQNEEEGEEPAEPNCGFIIHLGVVPPRPIRRAGDQRPLPYTAGCVWTEDWSCPYDAVFMAFWTLYEQSLGSWRDDWVQHVPDWNVPLKNNFDHLIILADTPVDVQDHATWFSRYRDRFRDHLSHTDPESFPRSGPVPASVSHILEVMFGRVAGPYLEQHLLCGDCGVLSQAEREIRYLAVNYGQGNKTPVWLNTVWTEFVHRNKTVAAQSRLRCSHCGGPNKVHVLKMPDLPWIWFERGQYSPVWPSLTLTFDSPSQQLNYSLRAIIYSGGKHFSVRFRAKSGEWWRQDGLVASGVPELDDIHSEADLLMNGTRFAYIVIYRRDGY